MNQIELTGQQLPAWMLEEEGSEWERYEKIDSENGVQLVDVGNGAFLVIYEEAGRRIKRVMCEWGPAQALYLRKVEEADHA